MATSGTIGEILGPKKISSNLIRKDTVFTKEDRSLLRYLRHYQHDDRTRDDYDELYYIHEVQNEGTAPMEEAFMLCLEKQNRTNRVECSVRVIGRQMTIICSPMSRGNTKINKSLRKLATLKSGAGSTPGGGNANLNKTNHSVESPDGINLNYMEDMAPFEAEYTLNLNEQYYELLEDKGDCYFQFIDGSQYCLLLFPRSDEAMLKWSTHFKKHCINTNLYECFEIEQLLYHNPCYNVYSCYSKIGNNYYSLKIFSKAKTQASINDIIKEMILLRIFQENKSRYISALHYVFETDSSIVFVLENRLTFSGLNDFIIFVKNDMYLKIFIMFSFLMFTREINDHSMYYTEVEKEDYFFQPHNEEYAIKCCNFLNFKRGSTEPEHVVTRINNYKAMVSFLSAIFKVDQIYYNQEDESVRSEIRRMISLLSNQSFVEVDNVLQTFIQIIDKYAVADKIMSSFFQFRNSYLSADQFLKAADQHMKSSFSKQTSHLTTSMKTFGELGRTNKDASKNSIPDITLRIESVLRQPGADKNAKYILGLNPLNRNMRSNKLMPMHARKKTRMGDPLVTGVLPLQVKQTLFDSKNQVGGDSKGSMRKSKTMKDNLGNEDADDEESGYEIEDVDIEGEGTIRNSKKLKTKKSGKSGRSSSKHSSSQREMYSKEEQHLTMTLEDGSSPRLEAKY